MREPEAQYATFNENGDDIGHQRIESNKNDYREREPGPSHHKKMVKIKHEDTELDQPKKRRERPLTA